MQDVRDEKTEKSAAFIKWLASATLIIVSGVSAVSVNYLGEIKKDIKDISQNMSVMAGTLRVQDFRIIDNTEEIKKNSARIERLENKK